MKVFKEFIEKIKRNQVEIIFIIGLVLFLSVLLFLIYLGFILIYKHIGSLFISIVFSLSLLVFLVYGLYWYGYRTQLNLVSLEKQHEYSKEKEEEGDFIVIGIVV